VTRRGWAIIALAEIGGKEADDWLAKVQSDPKHPMLVRAWAAAARVSMIDTADGLIEKASLVSEFPSLGRPIGMRLVELLRQGNDVPAEGMLSVTLKVPQLQQSLAPAILALGSKKLSTVMVTSRDQSVRYHAAAFLGTLSQQGDRGVGTAVITAYRFDPDATDVPWHGGPLYVPGLNWSRNQARALVGQLIAWHVWCDRHGRPAEQRQIHNNLMSNSLAGAAGYQLNRITKSDTVTWLTTWGKAVGRAEMLRMLKEQGVESNSKYSSALEE
jgi:hypothetical protein